MARRIVKGGLPTRDEVLDFIQSSDAPAGKREIAKAFGLKGADKIALKALLKDMGDEGLIDAGPGRAFHKMGGIPKVTVLRVVDVDDGGRAFAVPERWEAEGNPPRLRVMERKGRGAPALGVGDRILSRTEEGRDGWIAHPMKKLLKDSELVLGVVHKEGERHWLRPVEKKERRELAISDLGEARVGDLVLAEKTGRPPRLSARVDTILGDPFAPRSFSLIAIHKHEIPHVFPDAVLAEAERMAKQPLGEREDLTHIPIVAIDPADARDHDDAVWAAADDDPGNEGGWKAIVAIADVSFYVRPGSALDKEARRRGNSVYFPDRVVPMLPETLSADVCSLKEGEDRAALACHLQVSKAGALKSWRFTRARVRIAANIAYEDAQAAIDAEKGQDRIEVSSPTCSMPEIESDGPVPRALVQATLKPLWACWQALYKARDKRAPLELDLPERRVMLDEKGRILSVAPRERLDAHKLIEDYMIAANVAAAKALEARRGPVMYRVHEPPAREKLVALKDYLKTFGIEFALGQVIRPETFNRIIDRLGEAEFRPQVMEQILRTQTQAYYAPRNQGHFGLALGSYAHFTSPIRRYADLLVHRSLVASYRLGEGGLAADEEASMEVTGELISNLERRAMVAERETLDRYVAAYLSDHVGQVMDCRITGVQPFGFFATVEALGGDGLVPAAILGSEYFRYDESSLSLTGEESGERYTLGQRLKLRLVEADPVSGNLRFELPEGAKGGERPSRPRGPRRDGAGHMVGRRGRPGNIRHRSR
ncbi:VacB/RNase II family 3'-5' exoribonuclease [Sphingosinicella sp. LHD-64]|uniref:ribonuclease R family protein n=1 Tax=Sphingosinicella sp. LHD-64 TaxID=3072139 RepID=UPI00280E5982|nr:VacB/RNase II family 3'-5' exoribonuclease [Sphingosinicella sp. LHD-64]MDQ8757330.1 VacB/RNase II family 3'-5' exoribonuclease [Sphingosinicella sp. LHD-64]